MYIRDHIWENRPFGKENKIVALPFKSSKDAATSNIPSSSNTHFFVHYCRTPIFVRIAIIDFLVNLSVFLNTVCHI